MSLNTAEQLRFLMSDRPRFNKENLYGDGTATIFKLAADPLISGSTALGGFTPSAFVPLGNTAWSATGATFSYTLGTVAFSGVITAESAFMVHYSYGTFSDQEIDLVTAMYGDIPSMKLTLISNLMGDAYKRQRWATERGGFYDDSETMRNLMLMYSATYREIYGGPQGNLVELSTNQSNG